MDRTYWHVPGARSWHALKSAAGTARDGDLVVYHAWSECGLEKSTTPQQPFHRADRLPPTAHLCGNCSRIIAARTDIEDVGMYPTIQHDDVPEPVASEQNDWSPV